MGDSKKVIASVLIIVSCLSAVRCADYFPKKPNLKVEEQNVKVAENHLAAQIHAILEHFKQEDPIGMPGIPIPDPMPVNDTTQKMAGATMQLSNMLVHGISKFRLISTNMDLQNMRVETLMQLDNLKTTGNYKLKAFMGGSDGPFTVILKNVYCQGNASLAVGFEGKIQVDDIVMDLKFDDMSADFQNLGFIGSVFQSVVNSQPKVIFDTMKPFMLKEAYSKMTDEVNANLDKAVGDQSFSNSISPLDMIIAEMRKEVRNRGFDPFRVPDYNQTAGVFAVMMKNTWVTGISSFYRVGNVTTTLLDKVATMGLQIGTQKIIGSTHWEFKMGYVSQAGTAQFSVQHFKITSVVSQSLDTRKRPQLKELQLELGNIQVRCDGAGTFDYVTELAVNVLPNILRYQIMDAIENPIKMRVQEELNKFDVEYFVKNNITKFIEDGPENFEFDLKFLNL